MWGASEIAAMATELAERPAAQNARGTVRQGSAPWRSRFWQRAPGTADLERQAKQAHWNVKGPNFIALHELFDKVAEAAEEFTDLLAERATALGGIAEGRLQVVAGHSTLPPYPNEIVAEREHVDVLSTALAVFGKAAREAIDEAARFGDADTADVFTEISRETDKQLWLVETHLHG